MPADTRLGELAARVRRDVPCSPGVYMWLGGHGDVLYIGKSRDLRHRMLSYLATPAASFDRHRLLRRSIRDFAFRPLQGELLALLLEDALIKRLNPRHNERQRDYKEMCYLVVRGDGGYLASTDPGDPRGTVYGPFKDRYAVRDLIDLFSGAPVSAARAGVATRATDDHIRRFLRGDAAELEARYARDMELASARQDYERAAAARDTICFIQRFASRQRFLDQWRSGCLSVFELAAGLTYHFEAGQLTEVLAHDGTQLPVPGELHQACGDPRQDVQRALVVHDYCRRGLGRHLSAAR